MRAEIEFRDVGFHYPGADHPVLTDISFTTFPGETTAIVGSTGAGKTTLLQLIPRLFDVTAGSVLIGGVDVRDLDTDFLWSTIGLVPQRPYLFSGTVASNLAYGKPDATEAEMWEALEVAQATDFVRRMPGGLEARIDQGGTNVSGGQRQRLAIARALVRKPDIYLFDDSFSALDLATDARLRAALEPYTADSAVLIVAQRVSTITSADRILVLEDGEVVGMGTDAELRDTCPTYAEIVQSQIGEQGGRRDRPSTTGKTEDRTSRRATRRHAETRAAGGAGSGRRPHRALQGFRDGGAPAGPAAVAERAEAPAGGRGVGRRRDPQRVRPAACSGHATDLIVDGVVTARHQLLAAAHGVCWRRSPSTPARPCSSLVSAYTLAGVVQRLMLPAAAGGGGQDPRPAAQLHRPGVARATCSAG